MSIIVLQVHLASDCIGPEVAQKVAALKDGEVSTCSLSALLPGDNVICCEHMTLLSREVMQCVLPLQVLLLENTRFHSGECQNDPSFAQQVGTCLLINLQGNSLLLHEQYEQSSCYMPSVLLIRDHACCCSWLHLLTSMSTMPLAALTAPMPPQQAWQPFCSLQWLATS